MARLRCQYGCRTGPGHWGVLQPTLPIGSFHGLQECVCISTSAMLGHQGVAYEKHGLREVQRGSNWYHQSIGLFITGNEWCHFLAPTKTTEECHSEEGNKNYIQPEFDIYQSFMRVE